MSTLVVKLAATFVKQLSKPMAKVFTSYVMRKPELRKTIVDLSQVGGVFLLLLCLGNGVLACSTAHATNFASTLITYVTHLISGRWHPIAESAQVQCSPGPLWRKQKSHCWRNGRGQSRGDGVFHGIRDLHIFGVIDHLHPSACR